jgi:hypothetical protein
MEKHTHKTAHKTAHKPTHKAAHDESEDQVETGDSVAVDQAVESKVDGSLKKPELKGHDKPKPLFEQPGTDNMSRSDIGAESEQN